MAVDRHWTAGSIEPRELAEEMRSCYLDYAMSVIVGRALPDVRDGLKPVHRRVLFAMNERGLAAQPPVQQMRARRRRRAGQVPPARRLGRSTTRWCAWRRTSRCATRWSTARATSATSRRLLAGGHALHGVPRCRRSPSRCCATSTPTPSTSGPTTTSREREPTVLPSRVPEPAGQRLGRHRRRHGHQHPAAQPAARSIDATIDADRQPRRHDRRPDAAHQGARLPDRRHRHGPGGHPRGLRDRPRPRDACAPRSHIEELKGGNDAIDRHRAAVPGHKGGDDGVIAKIADLVQRKGSPRSRDIADESDRTGMRISSSSSATRSAKVVLNKLYKHTPLQTTFGVNIVALVGGEPRTLVAEGAARSTTSPTRRRSSPGAPSSSSTGPRSAPHILEGYLIALDNLDEVIELIRAAPPTPTTRASALMERFELTEAAGPGHPRPAAARPHRPRARRVKDEHDDLVARIERAARILADEAACCGVIKQELTEIRARFADDRRTEIVAGRGRDRPRAADRRGGHGHLDHRSGYIKRLPLTTYRSRRGGVGVMGMDLKDDDCDRASVRRLHARLPAVLHQRRQGLPR